MEILGAAVFAVLLIVGLVLYSAFAWGYVASIIYKWFILSQFTELPVITWWQFAGIMFFINCFIHTANTHYFKEEVKDNTTGLTISLLSPWLMLFGAWIFKVILFN
jgi:hypothetical protein